jgi:5-formyltetrahydrofolate cyclo-ligase
VLTDAKSLNFTQFNASDELQPNQHSILEPVSTQHIVHANKLDLVITPLLAFDKVGNRVGAGGGYYDRTFAFLFTNPEKSPFLLGLGYEIQRCEDLHPEPWDIKLNGVLTEKSLVVF